MPWSTTRPASNTKMRSAWRIADSRFATITVVARTPSVGLRIVASDVPGVTEVIGDRGARVEPGSVEALRRALAAEIRHGQARVAPVVSDDIDSHAARLRVIYRESGVGRRGDVRAAPL